MKRKRYDSHQVSSDRIQCGNNRLPYLPHDRGVQAADGAIEKGDDHDRWNIAAFGTAGDILQILRSNAAVLPRLPRRDLHVLIPDEATLYSMILIRVPPFVKRNGAIR